MLIKGFPGNMVHCFVCIYLKGLTSLMNILDSIAIAVYSAMSKEDVVLYLNLFLLFKILAGTNEYTVKYGKMSIKYIMIDILQFTAAPKKPEEKKPEEKKPEEKKPEEKKTEVKI